MNHSNNIADSHNTSSATNPNDVRISYSGNLDSQVVSSLFTQAETYLDSLILPSGLKTKTLDIITELLQNILDEYSSEVQKNSLETCSFILEQSKNKFIISTTNQMPARRIGSLKKRIEYLNSLTPGDLIRLYQDILNNGNPALETAGLGFIDIRRKSGNPILYKFFPGSNKYVVFSVKAVVYLR